MGPQNLSEQLRIVRGRIQSATQAGGRSVDSVTLLAASKAQPAERVRALAQLGVRDFGESYVQEALEKVEALRDLSLTWHFIGRLQANKTRTVASSFDWVHGVDRLKIAERLSEQRPFHAPALNICLQVNIGDEASKGGVTTAELPELVPMVAALPRVKLRGLMCIPPDEDDPSRQRAWFAKMYQAFESLNAAGAALDTLSMGMSGDLEAAILEGATLVRVGTALFGPRPPHSSTLTGSQTP
jgi:pyridoxal phosphate enzyme (YggS family)